MKPDEIEKKIEEVISKKFRNFFVGFCAFFLWTIPLVLLGLFSGNDNIGSVGFAWGYFFGSIISVYLISFVYNEIEGGEEDGRETD